MQKERVCCRRSQNSILHDCYVITTCTFSTTNRNIREVTITIFLAVINTRNTIKYTVHIVVVVLPKFFRVDNVTGTRKIKNISISNYKTRVQCFGCFFVLRDSIGNNRAKDAKTPSIMLGSRYFFFLTLVVSIFCWFS